FRCLSRPSPSSPMMTRDRKWKFEEYKKNRFQYSNFLTRLSSKSILISISRRALRIYGRLVEIEKEAKYRFEWLIIVENDSGVRLIFRDNGSVSDDVTVPHSDLMRKNSQFKKLFYKTVSEYTH
ncbi:hypothetical protein PENTCL1PPCAC_13190, partial [Pristionchus entomophagus]